MITSRFAGVAALAVVSFGQLHAIDTDAGITIGFAIPDVDEPPFDVIVSVSAPADVGWAGVAWGSGAERTPLSVAWPNGETVVASPRWIGDGSYLQPYECASLFVFPTPESSSSGWTVTFLCQGCSEWDDGRLDPNGENELALVAGARPVNDAADPDTEVGRHFDRGYFGVDLGEAKLADDEWDTLIASLWRDENEGELEGGLHPSVYWEEKGLGGGGEVDEEIARGQELKRRQDDGPIEVIIISSHVRDPEPTATSGDTEPTGGVENPSLTGDTGGDPELTDVVEEPEPTPEPTDAVEEPEPSPEPTDVVEEPESSTEPTEVIEEPSPEPEPTENDDPEDTPQQTTTGTPSDIDSTESLAETTVNPPSPTEGSTTEAPGVTEPTGAPGDTTVDVPSVVEPEPTESVDEPEDTPAESASIIPGVTESTGASGGISIVLPSTTGTAVEIPSTEETAVEIPTSASTPVDAPGTTDESTTAEGSVTRDTSGDLETTGATEDTTVGVPSLTEPTVELSTSTETTGDSSTTTGSSSFTLVPDDPIPTSESVPPSLTNVPVPDDPIVDR